MFWKNGGTGYHNAGEVSWFEFAKTILDYASLKVGIVPIISEELGRPAKRPAYSVMSTIDVENLLGIKMRLFEEALKEHLARVSA